ncbi:hypothetical protein K438DRAFT_1774884 [Mycena galopus ATCC 62051]|nr:hypothetical protein K438DRAFT_1774884 [Mycena galopus ATCC 62051]
MQITSACGGSDILLRRRTAQSLDIGLNFKFKGGPLFVSQFRQLLLTLFHSMRDTTRMLGGWSVTTYKEFVQYLQALCEIMRDINQCAKKAEEIRTSALLMSEPKARQKIS